ncbi:hypothetical protein J1614_001177 [Plenodomus biglobosus]|nr:hypothetical protein J1614_001177 [Plenodomus biglobosus]
MTRVNKTRAQHARQRSTAPDRQRAAHPKKKPYKIVLEAVTQEKKKLHSILTYASNAPTGFGFIPAGNPEVTEWCKEQCRQRNLDVHIVSAKPRNKMHADPEKLSHHVHRVGHHFPLEIVQLACSKFGYKYDEAKGLRKARTSDRINWIAQSMENYSTRQALHGRPSSEKETKKYIHGAVREMFPKIPEADLSSIVNHAFQEGTNRVGNAKELPLARRVQLAVVAHIRHTYTDYDKLLKTDGWSTARSQVEHVSLAKLKEWRDEAGERSNELEETFREVIVLDDDDSSDGDTLSISDEREQSMEIVSSRATARDLQPGRYANRARVHVHGMKRSPRRSILLPRSPPHPPTAAYPALAYGGSAVQSPSEPARPHNRFVEMRSSPRIDTHHLTHSRSSDSRMRPHVSQSSSRSAAMLGEIGGRLYELQPIEETHSQARVVYDLPPRRATSRYVHDRYVPSPVRPSSSDRPPAHSRRPSEQDVVLPSVEREIVDLTSVDDGQRPSRGYDHLSGHTPVQSPKRKAYTPLSSDRPAPPPEQGSKRVRPVSSEERFYRYAHQDGPPHMLPHPPLDPRRAPPPQVVNVGNPYRLPPDRGHYMPAYSYQPAPEQDDRSYVPASARPPPPRETRGAHYGAPVEALSYAYVSEPRMYERRASLPAHDFVPLRDDRRRCHLDEESAQYLRSRVKYGG